jgi:arsenate reductase
LKVYGLGVNVSELAHEAGIAASAVRWYEETGVLPAPHRRPNGYRDYGSGDLARLRLVVALRRLGLAPLDAGRLACLCLEGGAADMALAPFLASQRAAIDRQRAELDRLDAELMDLGNTIVAAGRAAATREDTMTDQPIRVLFVCTGNSARSQMAEAMLTAHGHGEFQVFSAGTEPRGVNPFAVQVLAEMGIDWSAARAKSVTEFIGQPFDYVITVCDRARQVCPVFPGQHNSLHWGLDDPAEVQGSDAQKVAAFRRTQTELGARLRPFIELARRARRETAAV